MTPVERLKQLHEAHIAAGGPAEIVALTGAVLATSPSEDFASATNAYIEGRSAVKETIALAEVARAISADPTPPTLWLQCDVRATHPAPNQTVEQTLRTDGALRVRWAFRREPTRMLDDHDLAVRLLFPERSAAHEHTAAAGRILREIWSSWVPPRDVARAALLAAAVERNTQNEATK
jgi:hypothetical protein